MSCDVHAIALASWLPTPCSFILFREGIRICMLSIFMQWFGFRTGDVEAIARQLESMRTSLDVLKNSPDYDDKVK